MSQAATTPIAWNKQALAPGPEQDAVIRGITGEARGKMPNRSRS